MGEGKEKKKEKKKENKKEEKKRKKRRKQRLLKCALHQRRQFIEIIWFNPHNNRVKIELVSAFYNRKINVHRSQVT